MEIIDFIGYGISALTILVGIFFEILGFINNDLGLKHNGIFFLLLGFMALGFYIYYDVAVAKLLLC